jgi:IPT/TIG domain
MNKKIGVAFCVLACSCAGFALQDVKVVKPEAVPAQTVQMAKPKITDVRGKCLYHTGELDVIGVRFGGAQGNREVVLNGVVREVLFWQDTVIRVSHMYDFPAGQTIKVFLREQGTGDVLSNTFEFFNLYCIYSVEPPGNVTPGTDVEIKVKPGMGAGSHGRNIVIGGKPATIVSWTNDTVRFKVPVLTPGEYQIHIKKAGHNLSYPCPITVK